jgi:hypothetical protein
MELDDLKTMWQSNDVKLEKSLKLNEQTVELIQTQKLVSKLAPLYRQRLVECILHSVAILLLLLFLYKNISELPYAVSAIALLIFYATTFINALKQIRLIKKMDFNTDLATTQSSLMILQTHAISYAKMAVLFIPTFLAYPTILTKVIKDLNITALAEFDIITKSNGSWWMAQMVTFIVLIPLGIWFYRQVTYKNMDKTWVKNFIQKSSGKRVTKALMFLKELQGLRQNIG